MKTKHYIIYLSLVILKITIFVILIVFLSSCSIKPICHLDYQKVIITGYVKSTKVYQCESVNHTCYGSFYCYEEINKNDTVLLHVLLIGSIHDFIPPTVEIIK